MSKKSLFFLTTIVLLSVMLPAFAEVTELQLDRKSYLQGDSINVKGTVSSDSSGLVTIVLRDPSDKFVLLSQAVIQADDSFENTIPINEKFQVTGTHNATAFVQNVTAGKTQSFDLLTTITEEAPESSNNFLDSIQEIESALKEESKLIETEIDNLPKITEPPIVEPVKEEPQEKLIDVNFKTADFVDKNKEPQYYLDRYYDESAYKSWFDRNYPDLTIEDAVGYPITVNYPPEPAYENFGTEIIPEAQATSIVSTNTNSENNSDIAHMGLAIGGMALLFGAVYGIKRKVDVNSMHISLNKDIIRRKIISPIIDSNPIGIIQTRLAKGEISIEEYENLKQKLDKNSK